MAIYNIFLFSCSYSSAPWFPFINQTHILEHHKTLPLDLYLYYFFHYSYFLKELSGLFGLSGPSFPTVDFIISPMTLSMFVTALNSLLLEASHRKFTCSVVQQYSHSLFMLFYTFKCRLIHSKKTLTDISNFY